MPKKGKGKQALIALALTLAVECILLMILGWGGATGWIDAGHLLGPVIAVTVISSAVGALYLGTRQWGAVPAALLPSVAVQFLLFLAGYFVFGAAGFGGSRWCLPLAGFVSAVLAVLFLARPKKRKAKHRTK